MNEFQLTTPIVFIIFNRPSTTQKVFEEIRKAKPAKLMVIADGPRWDMVGEAKNCTAARAIVEQVDWDCEVLKNYSDVNLGIGKRVASGLDWVFSLVEEAIILEDDCLPHQDMFRFFQEMLELYRDDARIMAISGTNYQFGRCRMEYSYHFSRYAQQWGWATWRRGWKYYDFEMKLWPEFHENRYLLDVFGHITASYKHGQHHYQLLEGVRDSTYWYDKFEAAYNGVTDTWYYPFLFACLIQYGLIITPNVNLVSNIGFGPEATNCTTITELANVPVISMEFPLKHPPFIIRDVWADEYLQSIFVQSC